MQLSPKIENLLRQKIEQGHYRSADDLIREAVEALDERERRLDEEALAFKAEMDRRAKSPGRVMTDADWEAFDRRVMERYEAEKA